MIINYGCKVKITNKPNISWYSADMAYTKNSTFIINNDTSKYTNAYIYDSKIPTFIGDKYKITILAKQIPNYGQ
ncbi:hypothetical protein EPJ69_12095 [Brachyspira aalborgi]|uniref:Uncharacterized protein n=1 Tax=Brachyspira aalborgi TaxID=29522 RepID=A0A5C8DWD6_9SPIR|nr:hypothetical protein [Brachyspira aalborgi]TXJ29970.1 hypothetical protein EPJ69_12095 [Brachyspira aalborgi]